jgi:CHASE2 domain-containing sensor protein
VPSVSTTPPAVRRTPPIPAILAVLLGLLSSLAVAFFGVLALAFSNGQFAGGGWLVILVPAVLAVVLVVGVILLLLGRSWLALVVPAGALGAVLVAAELTGWWDERREPAAEPFRGRPDLLVPVLG